MLFSPFSIIIGLDLSDVPEFMFRLLALLLLSFSFINLCYAETSQLTRVSICEDDTEVFPMTYYERGQQHLSNERLTGFTVEVITKIFRKHQIDWELDLIPWSRCLYEVKKGKKYQMLLNAVSNPQRRADYYFSAPHFASNNFYFYAKERYPNGLPIHSPADLNNYVLGGVYGYDQSVFGVEESQILVKSKSLPKLIQMMYKGRFDVFMAGSDVIPWMKLAFPELNISQRLGYAPLKGTKGTFFYMMFSKAWPQSKALQTLINKEIALMQVSGEWQQLLHKYDG